MDLFMDTFMDLFMDTFMDLCMDLCMLTVFGEAAAILRGCNPPIVPRCNGYLTGGAAQLGQAQDMDGRRAGEATRALYIDHARLPPLRLAQVCVYYN